MSFNISAYEVHADTVVLLLGSAGRAAPLFEAGGLPDPGACKVIAGDAREADARETDVHLAGGGSVLLVETKIGDQFRPGQPESYHAEADRLRAAGTKAAAIVFAPRAHLARLPAYQLSCFDGCLAMEDLADWLDNHYDDPMTRAAVALLRNCCAPVRSLVAHAPTVEFGIAYRQLLAQVSHLPLHSGSLIGAAAEFANFYPPPGGWSLWHDIAPRRAAVKLGLPRPAWPAQPPDLPPGALVDDRPTNKSVLVKIPVPPVSKTKPFAEQIDEILVAIDAAERLYDWAVAFGRAGVVATDAILAAD